MHGRDITKKLHHTSKSQSLTRDYKLNSLIFIQIAIFHSNIHISIYQYNNYVIKNCTIYKKRKILLRKSVNRKIKRFNFDFRFVFLYTNSLNFMIQFFNWRFDIFLKIFFIDDSENGWMEMEVYFWEKNKFGIRLSSRWSGNWNWLIYSKD